MERCWSEDKNVQLCKINKAQEPMYNTKSVVKNFILCGKFADRVCFRCSFHIKVNYVKLAMSNILICLAIISSYKIFDLASYNNFTVYLNTYKII